MQATIYTQEGKEAGNLKLPEQVFAQPWNPDLVHQVVVAMQANARGGNAHTKDRSEVSGGGRKPWRQKGTGRARHGSRRSPIWTGGGVTHGPRNEKDFTKKLNKKVRQKALATVLSKKQSDAEVIFVDALAFTEPKSATAKTIITALASGSGHADLATKRRNAALVVVSGRNEALEKSFRNFGNMEVKAVKDINPVDLLTYKYVVIADPQTSIDALQARVGGGASAVTTKS